MSAGLFRAIVSSHLHGGEMVVFFEVPGVAAGDEQAALETLLCAVWGGGPDDVQVWHLAGEHLLLNQLATGPAADGDMRLFEVSTCWGSPVYVGPDRTLMLVCPRTLARLQAAQRSLPIVVADDATAAMPLAA